MEYLFFCADNKIMKKKLFFCAAIFFLVVVFLAAENPLLLGKSDIRPASKFNKTSDKIEECNISIRNKNGLDSARLSESAKSINAKKMELNSIFTQSGL